MIDRLSQRLRLRVGREVRGVGVEQRRDPAVLDRDVLRAELFGREQHRCELDGRGVARDAQLRAGRERRAEPRGERKSAEHTNVRE